MDFLVILVIRRRRSRRRWRYSPVEFQWNFTRICREPLNVEFPNRAIPNPGKRGWPMQSRELQLPAIPPLRALVQTRQGVCTYKAKYRF
jgi:hypothetical protein